MSYATGGREGAACDAPWSRPGDDVLEILETDAVAGLAASEVLSRRNRFGLNLLDSAKRRSIVSILYDQFKSVVILLLAAAAAVALLLGDVVEMLAIIVVILINGAVGFLTEWRAIRSMEALSRLGQVVTVAVRDGRAVSIPAEQLVPGDIVPREAGDIVTADMRLIEAADLRVDESTLTGESMPVSKHSEVVPLETEVMDRSNMLFKGTAITRGSAKGVVVGIGLGTELGRISSLVSEARAQETPLEKRLDRLAQRLVWIVLLLVLLIAVAGYLSGRDTWLTIEISIALAVAAIPEGLPVVATIALARGMWRMAKRNALISRLSAVETLGATSVILTDKTGTLTENRMSVSVLRLPEAEVDLTQAASVRDASNTGSGNADEAIRRLLCVAALCNNATLSVDEKGSAQAVGDPTEVALLRAAANCGVDREDLLQTMPRAHELPFDSETKIMATQHEDADAVLVAVKGAPEAGIGLCTRIRTAAGDVPLSEPDRETWLGHATALAGRGLRTLLIAERPVAGIVDTPCEDLVLLGIVGLEDPPRAGIREAIERCRDAGISVVMMTGDHAATARNIAIAVGIIDEDADPQQLVPGDRLEIPDAPSEDDALAAGRVFSRVTPEQKLQLIHYYQKLGRVVAMTGDGVNDAPALKKADIGVAMGIRGTAVAKEASAMVLQDDNFGTIVEAVAQGRTIFENIRKFVVYLLSCNISEILVVTIATLAGAPLPLLPLQILFLNLVTDVFPALALGVGEGSPDLMKQAPRPATEPIMTRQHWLRVGLHGLVISLTVLCSMAIAILYLDIDTKGAVTVSFCTLALAQVWHVFNMRSNLTAFFRNEITRNAWVWAAVLLCILLTVAAVYVPQLAATLELQNPGLAGWQLILAMSLVPLILGPPVEWISSARSTRGSKQSPRTRA